MRDTSKRETVAEWQACMLSEMDRLKAALEELLRRVEARNAEDASA